MTGSDLHNGLVNEYETQGGAIMVAHDTRDGVQIGDAVVKRIDVQADNDIIQAISRITLPPDYRPGG